LSCPDLDSHPSDLHHAVGHGFFQFGRTHHPRHYKRVRLDRCTQFQRHQFCLHGSRHFILAAVHGWQHWHHCRGHDHCFGQQFGDVGLRHRRHVGWICVGVSRRRNHHRTLILFVCVSPMGRCVHVCSNQRWWSTVVDGAVFFHPAHDFIAHTQYRSHDRWHSGDDCRSQLWSCSDRYFCVRNLHHHCHIDVSNANCVQHSCGVWLLNWCQCQCQRTNHDGWPEHVL